MKKNHNIKPKSFNYELIHYYVLEIENFFALASQSVLIAHARLLACKKTILIQEGLPMLQEIQKTQIIACNGHKNI